MVFEDSRYALIKAAIVKQIKLNGQDYFMESAIRSKYVEFDQVSDYNGYKLLEIDKVKNLLVYFSTYIKSLYKVKLMKLLWFADAEAFKELGHSLTGLVYRHMPLGAVPIAHNEIMALSSINVEEEVHGNYTAYRITPNVTVPIQNFSIEELGILQRIVEKFGDFSTKDIVEYMHEERAYRETEENEIIPFRKGDWVRDI